MPFSIVRGAGTYWRVRYAFSASGSISRAIPGTARMDLISEPKTSALAISA